MAAEMAPLTVFPGQDLSHQGEAADRIFVLAEGARPRPAPCAPAARQAAYGGPRIRACVRPRRGRQLLVASGT